MKKDLALLKMTCPEWKDSLLNFSKKRNFIDYMNFLLDRVSCPVKTIFFVLISALHVNLSAQNLPQGFNIEVFASGLYFPTSMSFSPDGRLFITEKFGRVRIVENGVLLDQPFIQLETETQGE